MLRKACFSSLPRNIRGAGQAPRRPALAPAHCASPAVAASPDNPRHPVAAGDSAAIAKSLELALSRRRIHETWRTLQALWKLGSFPDRAAANNSVLLFSYAGDDLSLSRAYKFVWSLQRGKKLDLLDVDSLSLLALAFARTGKYHLAARILRILFCYDFFPALNVWTAVLELMVENPLAAPRAASVFLEVCIHIRRKRRQSSDFENFLLAMQPNKHTFHLALLACVTASDSEKAEATINEMQHLGLRLDNTCFLSLIKVYEKDKNLKALEHILHRIKQACVVPRRSTLTALVSALVKLKNIDAAAQLIRDWALAGKSKGYSGSSEDVSGYLSNSCESIDSLAYGILLKGFIDCRRTFEDAADFLVKIQEDDRSDFVDCKCAVDGLLQIGLRDEAHGIMQAMAAQNAPADCSAYTSLIKAYCRVPHSDKAEKAVQGAKKVGHELPIDCYESVLEMYMLIQEYMTAISVFKTMKRMGLDPLEPIFLRLLELLRRDSKPYMIRKLFDVAMKDPPLRVELKHWNVCIQCFCKARLMFDARMAVKRMSELSIQPDATTYATLLNGYYYHRRRVNEMLLLWLEVMGLTEPKKGVEPLKLTRNLLEGFLTVFIIYGYFGKALQVVAKMEEQNFVCDKAKYMDLYLEHHRNTFTSKHASQQRVERSQNRRDHNNFFRKWLGLRCVE